MSRVTTGDRRTLSPPSTTVHRCTLDAADEVISRTLRYIEYHRGPEGRPVYVLGRDAGGRDLIAHDVRDLADLEDAIARSGRVKPAPEPVEAEPTPIEVSR